jgi:hypothetical protein
MQQKNKGNADTENGIVSKANRLFSKKSFSIRLHNRAVVAKLILPIFLLFSTTVIMAISNPVQTVSAISFEKTKNLSNNAGDSENPQIEASGKNVYTVWSDASKGGGDILFRKSSDTGNSFNSIVDLSNGKSGSATEQKIVKQGDSVYVVWSEDGDVYFKKSINSGASFGSTINLSNDDHDSSIPQIAVVGNNVYVVWVDIDTAGGTDESQLFFKRSTDGGSSFGSLKKLSDVIETIFPRIAASGDNVYIAFGAGSEDDEELFFTRSTNEGSSFSNVVSINKNDETTTIGDIAAVGNNVYITWKDDSLNGSHAFFIRSTNGGSSFGNPKDLGAGAGGGPLPGNAPQIDTISDNVYVVWPDKDGKILFKASKNDGSSFGSTKVLSNSGFSPQISSSGNAVRVVWYGNTDGQSEVFFRASGNEGDSFGSIKNLSNNDGRSALPMIISSGGNAYVIWQDNTPGNYDIFFKKGVD